MSTGVHWITPWEFPKNFNERNNRTRQGIVFPHKIAFLFGQFLTDIYRKRHRLANISKEFHLVYINKKIKRKIKLRAVELMAKFDDSCIGDLNYSVMNFEILFSKSALWDDYFRELSSIYMALHKGINFCRKQGKRKPWSHFAMYL